MTTWRILQPPLQRKLAEMVRSSALNSSAPEHPSRWPGRQLGNPLARGTLSGLAAGNGQELIPFVEGAENEHRVPLLSMSASNALPDNSAHMGSIEQLRFGKMVGDALGGLDPVFGALLSPTGGIPGAGNVRVTNSLALAAAGGLDVVTNHGIAHDAAGYLLNYHQMGPGYQYVPDFKGWIPTTSPLAGQLGGLNFYGNVKLYGSPTVPRSLNPY